VTYLLAIASLNTQNAAPEVIEATRGENKAMKHLLRPYISLGITMALGAGLVVAPGLARAQGNDLRQLLQGSDLPFIGGSQGYLGVELADIDNDKAQALKLKEVRGAVITLIDHDAPAGQIGLKVNDVVIQLNGQNVESAEQLRRMLKEIPSGRKVSIEISRDGNIQTLAVELADRQVLGHDVWNKIGGGDVFSPPPSMGMLSSGGDVPSGNGGFHLPFFGSSLNVGAMVEPLTSQMAEYLGVQSGLMVKQVARKSDAALAGLKAFDVILKVGSEQVTNLAGWDRALRANQGKPVQITILRDKKQQTLTLQVDSKHHQGSLGAPAGFTADDCPMIAELNREFAMNVDGAADEWRKQAEAFQKSVKELKIDPKQVEQFQQQMDQLRKELNSGEMKLDKKQMDEFTLQLKKFEKQMDRQLRSLRGGDYV
jgi:serine protease Do